MTYLQPRKRSLGTSSKTLLLGSLTLGVFLIVGYFFSSPLQNFFLTLAAPAWSIEQGLFGSTGFFSALTQDRQKLIEQNTHLELSLVEARQNAALLRELYRQNRELKEILGRAGSNPSLLAAVLARPPRRIYDTLIIDVGSKHGVAVGDHAYVLGNVIIGDITEVYPDTSVVTLYSTAGRETDVLVGGMSATALGRGGGNFVVELPRDLLIATGTPVTLPDIGLSFFGAIETVISHPADPVQELYFRNPFALSELTFVTLDSHATSSATRAAVEEEQE